MSNKNFRTGQFLLVLNLAFSICLGYRVNPYEMQIDNQLDKLTSADPYVRAGAVQSLGFLRAYRSGDMLAGALKDRNVDVRRQAAMSLAWCGSRKHIDKLIEALRDEDWMVRQGAWVSLTNLTGMELPFDAAADENKQLSQARAWQQWWMNVPEDDAPREIYERLEEFSLSDEANFAFGSEVTGSTTYKGPPGVLTDGDIKGLYWQTKNVPFPQHCTVDLGKLKKVGCIIVYQYGRGFCMDDYELSVSSGGKKYERVTRKKGTTQPRLVISFRPRKIRYLRITSHSTENPTYPTTFFEIEAREKQPKNQGKVIIETGCEQAVRSLAVLGGKKASSEITRIIKPYMNRSPDDFAQKALVQTALRSLGRLGDTQSTETLIKFLDSPKWARYAADALGDCPSNRACKALIDSYPKYARDLQRKNPKQLPRDDHPSLEPADRMYETPYAISVALSRMPWNENNIDSLRKIIPLIAANIPSDFDGAMLYEPEAHQLVNAHLFEIAIMQNIVCEAIFKVLGCDHDRQLLDNPAGRDLVTLAMSDPGGIPFAATWMSTFCVSDKYAPRLIRLLEHENGWVRINAAKALMFNGSKQAVEPIGRILANSQPEAEAGYFGGFMFRGTKKQGHAEYDDMPPRWRQAYVRALGHLGAKQYVPVLVQILFDDRNVLEVQQAALLALEQLNTDKAMEAITRAEQSHPFHSIKLFAREILWKQGKLVQRQKDYSVHHPVVKHEQQDHDGKLQGFVFIKGDNDMPNDFQIDIWRQTYSTTDSGPAYRMGENLYVLSPAGKVRRLTNFSDGYVADCEVSYDGRQVIFAHRGGKDNPWWHIWRIDVDGSGLKQLTFGPYHDVGPVYLPDGRIVFSSSRLGMRDEYHGYYATGLTVMNPDGSDIHTIGLNLGRDNEPAILKDGRIVFGRLELFYSRLKTEIVLEAVYPDGTKNVTLYGPEKRDMWRKVTIDSGEKWWGEVAPRHRVLRLTQPQPYSAEQVICSTTAGLTIVGPGRMKERILRESKDMAVTSPYPMDDGRILCSATKREFDRKRVDLGLYYMDSRTGKLELLYNDPGKADFEARPIIPGKPEPMTLVENPLTRSSLYTGSYFCSSVKITRHPEVVERGKLLRVIEGQPSVARHHTHRSTRGEAWKNHTGTLARVLGTVPLGADGAFHVKVPADRLLHMQVLDSDRRVVGNQQIWMYVRPGEKRSCIGCHEKPDTTRLPDGFSPIAQLEPVSCLPTGGEFNYRAKFWNKGTLTDEGEERTRTVRAVNLIGRY